MKTRIQFHDGLVVDLNGVQQKYVYNDNVLCEITQDNVIRVHNLGRPYHISLNGLKYPGQPVYLESVIVQDEKLVPELFGWTPATKLADGIFIVLDKNHPKVPATQLPLSNDYHLLDGSDCFSVRFVDPADPAVKGNDQALAAYNLLNVDISLVSTYPRIARLLNFYKVNGSSFDPASTDRNFGWWLWPECYNKRWGNFPPLSYLKSHYGFVSTWANSDGLTNEHYDHPLYCLLNYLINPSDQSSLELGLMLIRKKINYGLYDFKDHTHPWFGFWKWEKGNRLGFFQAPASAKEWDTSLVIANLIHPEPIFQRALELRTEALLNRPNAVVWPRGAGGRMAGRYLQNLFIMNKANVCGKGIDVKNRAESFINYFFSVLKPNEKWIPNDYAPTYTDGWEGMTFFYFALKWIKTHNICTQHLDRLYEMLEWYCNYAIGFRVANANLGQAHYHINLDGTPTNPAENTPSHITYWYKLWPFIREKFGNRYLDKEVACNNTVFNYIGYGYKEIDAGIPPLDPNKLQFDSSGGSSLGVSAEKQWPMFLEMLIRL